MQDVSSFPHSWLSLVYTAIVLILGGAIKTLGERIIKRYRDPHEARKLEAESYSLRVTTDLDVLQELHNVITKAEARRQEWVLREEQLMLQRGHWQRKAEETEYRLLQAEADAKTAQMFVDQLHAAAKLKGVSLSEFTPSQLNSASE